MRTLRRYLTGNDVRYFQYLSVSEYGQKIAMDGSFGDGTFAAAKNVQEMLGFKGKEIDGLIGPATQARMGMTDFIVRIYDKKDVWFAGTPYDNQRVAPYPVYTLKEWAKREGADRVFNLALFNVVAKNQYGQTHEPLYGVVQGRTINYLKAKGYDCGYGGIAERIFVDSNNICGGQFAAIVKGVKRNVPGVSRAINANGILRNGKYFQVQSVMKATPKQLIDYMYTNFDVEDMLIQDYGGSTGDYDARYDCLLAGEREGTDGRKVASVVCVRESKIILPTKKYCPTCGQEIK